MSRRWLGGATIVLLVVAIVDGERRVSATSATVTPVVEADWPDPEVVLDPVSGQFTSLATNSVSEGVLVNLPVRTSTDLRTWSEVVHDALPVLPTWAEPGVVWGDSWLGWIWAPGVERIGDRWVLYFTARDRASGRQCVGVAEATAAVGPYEPVGSGPIVCQVDLGGSIDPSPFRDPASGRWWLHWKSDDNALSPPVAQARIWAAPLSEDGRAFAGGPVELLRMEEGVEEPAIENPDVVYASGWYWLFYSGGAWWSDQYFVHVARCESPAGPCRRIGDPASPWLGTSDGLVGPGGASVVTLPTDRRALAYVAWSDGVGYDAGGWRAMYVESLGFDRRSCAPVLRSAIDPAIGGVSEPDVIVDVLHLDFLGRPASTAEHRRSVRVRCELGQATAVQELARSDAWIGATVDALYLSTLGRLPDAGGRAYWIDVIRRGTTVAVVAAHFYASPEYFRRAGGDVDAWIRSLYEEILHRPAEPAGLAYWTGLARSGTPLELIAHTFYQSIESRRGRVRDLYVALLGRVPEAEGWAYWADVLRTGDDVGLAVHLASSEEYQLRAVRRGS